MNTHSPIKKGRKYDQVVAGARDVFMREGFEGASVDAIAKAAKVSKATLYSYFQDKRVLFMEVALTECRRQADSSMARAAESKQTIEQTLTDLAERMTGFFLSRFGQQVFRICVAEADRFPELGRSFYRSGPELARAQMSAILQQAVDRGELVIDDCALAADQFCELCKADLFNRLIFNVEERVSQSDVTRIIRGAVEMFMARYAARP